MEWFEEEVVVETNSLSYPELTTTDNEDYVTSN